MSAASTIEWTNATWNPVRGCSIVSKGCTNCYAMRQAHRQSGKGRAYEGLTKMTKGGPVWTGKLRLVPEQLDAPLHWKKPRRIFVNSMSDLFHEDVPDSFIDMVFAVMANHGRHTYQVLTKRPARMLDYLKALTPDRCASLIRSGHGASEKWVTRDSNPAQWTTEELVAVWPLPNVWLGVSVEDQASANERIPLLLQTHAAVRWISAEPMLGPIDFMATPLPPLRAKPWQWPGFDWVVAGGESGPGARPMHPDWARTLRDQCAAAGVPFFFKQWGAWMEVDSAGRDPETGDHFEIEVPSRCAEEMFEYSTDLLMAKDGRTFRQLEDLPPGLPCRQLTHGTKKQNGRKLDGRTHDEYPA